MSLSSNTRAFLPKPLADWAIARFSLLLRKASRRVSVKSQFPTNFSTIARDSHASVNLRFDGFPKKSRNHYLSGIPSLAYNGRVDRANAIRLLKALIAAGANSNTLMVNAWVDDIAQREASLRGTELSSALAYAEGQGWIGDGPRPGWTIITREGERAARLRTV
jgi:hypothetical protein